MRIVERKILHPIVYLFFAIAAILILASAATPQATLTEIKKALHTDFLAGLYSRTYYSLLDRVDVDGFVQESLTGRYPGMFPRTVGGIVSLFLETGELDISEKIINCTLEAMTANEMERLPHVFLRQQNDLVPVFNGDMPMQPLTTTPVIKLTSHHSAAVKFTASGQPILAVEAAISLNACRGILTMSLRQRLDGQPISTKRIAAKQGNPGQIWRRFEFANSPQLHKGHDYFIRFDFDGFGISIWYGMENEPQHAGVFLQNEKTKETDWTYQKNIAPAFAVDVGNLRHELRSEPYKIYCDWDQIDGQAHVIMAWARLALARERTPFEDRTYPLVAKLMDRTSDQPYFMWARGHAISVNLVQNVGLEHSREGRYWHAWDILTQCVVGASLEAMIQIAQQRGDSKHALCWQDRLQVLKKGIAQNLTREINGKKVYLEMRLPNSAGGVPFTGMGWMNFAPIMAQWEPLDRQVLRNTIALLREKLLLEHNGQKYLAMEFDQDGTVHDDWIIGKGVGWEIDYARQEKEYDRIMEWLQFLQAFHYGDFYSEAMHLDESGKWVTGDGGNGEQSSWWCWAIARLRKEVGLPVVGEKPQ